MDINSIDIVGERVDGCIDLYIVVTESIEKSEELQTQLLDKIENYLVYIKSPQFKKDYPNISVDKVYIKLKFTKKISEMLLKWLREVELWVNSEGVNLLISS